MAKPTSTQEYFEALPADRRKVLGQTIQFPADEPLPVGLVKKLVRSRAAELRAEKD
jgi:hypothetical protein